MSELSRVKMRCRRGLKELDVIFQHYLERHYNSASTTELQRLDELLAMQDPLIWDMLLDAIPFPDQYTDLIAKLRVVND
ncbi:FAD assembly factor SdhE [Thiothrix subterranea]|uniref:FAD assembly factor SdhE n=1 Tax=Thiothrix subterranea TaxID=2735563 RepID=A0AA51QVW5_9GAMM|nr:succinate dehydrogenase assembly factor 2 [Thiothrix subterranea]MDQ5768163.1 succinate dehydrogenase assembly factor 2 [Thiothrix subterranea]QQZ27465.1 succinate dehydrogenase assembly factor 2 [Thiothrix subterranea]WML85343.1 succinate dehydrogenase assembly factor 2 [Thiothrix subterranea]